MPLMMEPSYMLILIVGAIITMGAQFKVKSAFAKWSKVPNERGLSGAETART